MSASYRFIEDPSSASSVLQWFRERPDAPEEVPTPRGLVLNFRAMGALVKRPDGAVDARLSPVATLFPCRVQRAALWTVGEVHFLSGELKTGFPALHALKQDFARWLRQHELVFSNKPGAAAAWNHWLEGSVRNHDGPVYALPTGMSALQQGRYFVSDGESPAVLERVCATLRLRGIDCTLD